MLSPNISMLENSILVGMVYLKKLIQITTTIIVYINIACELGGMPDHQLQMLKMFVMHRVIPKYTLKGIYETLQICIKLTSVNSSDRTITETMGDKNKTSDRIGLACDHYFIIEKN